MIPHSVKINRLHAERDYAPTEEQIERALEKAFKLLEQEK
jgi:hypothetical protein